MKRTGALLLCVLLTLFHGPAVIAAPDYDEAASSVVRVLGYDNNSAATGSAFVISQVSGSTYLVTNRHVVIGYDQNGVLYDYRERLFILLDNVNDVMLPATPLIVSTNVEDGLDYAILKVETGLSKRPVLPLASAHDVKRGDSIHVCGFPGAADALFGDYRSLPSTEEDVTVAPGTITNTNKKYTNTDIQYLQHDAFTSGGNSGGPVLNDDGAVVGVHTLGYEGDKGALYIDYIIEQCDRLGIEYTMYTAPAPSEAPASEPVSVPPGETENPNEFLSALARLWWIPVIVLVLAAVVSVAAALNKGKASPAQPQSAPQPMPQPQPAPQPMPQTAPVSAPVSDAHLLCTKGHFAGTTFPIKGSLFLGRDPARCQIVFPENAKGISSLHCQVSITPSGVRLADQGSTYGTFLPGGRKLAANESVYLKPGDSFCLADHNNEFKVL